MRIVCCDDKIEITEYLVKNIEEICKSADVSANIISFNTGESLLSYCIKNTIDILFLDIDLGTSNGISIAKALNQFMPNLQIIYITAYSKYIDKICFSNFENILIKPICEDKLRYVLFQAIGNVSSMKAPSLILHYQNDTLVIDTNDITYIESEKRKVYVHLKNGEYETAYCKISEIYDQLPKNFIHFHRCFIVNMREIKQVYTSSLTLKNGQELPIPVKRYKELLDAYLEFRKAELE